MSMIRQFTNSFPGGVSLSPPGEEAHIEQLQYLLLIKGRKCINLHNILIHYDILVISNQVFAILLWSTKGVSSWSFVLGLRKILNSVFVPLFSTQRSQGKYPTDLIVLIKPNQVLSKIFQCISSYLFLPKQRVYNCHSNTFSTSDTFRGRNRLKQGRMGLQTTISKI